MIFLVFCELFNKQMKKIKKWIHINRINILVSLFSIFVSILLFFAVLLFIEQKSRYIRQNEFIFYEYDEILGWKNKPNSNGTFQMPDSTSYVRINSKGLRDSEHSYLKKKNITRIQFLGDSFVWGYGVEEEERFTNVFKRELDNYSPNVYEVINLGTSGYGTDQEYLLLKNEGIKYEPDIVIMAYHNDVADVSRDIAYSYPRPFFLIENDELKLTNVPVPERLVSWDERYFAEDSLLDKGSIKSDMITTLQVIDMLILESQGILVKNNATLIILLIPDKAQVYGDVASEEIDHIVNFAQMNGIRFINLLPDLKRIGKEEKKLYFEKDGHFSKIGNEIVGNLIAEDFFKMKFFEEWL